MSTHTEERAKLRDAFARALHATFPGDWHHGPHYECRPCQERATAVMTARDTELDRLRNQVADYERQLLDAEAGRNRLRTTSEQVVTDLTAERDALAAELEPVHADRKAIVDRDALHTCLPFIRWCVEQHPEKWRTDLAENGQAALERISDDLASAHPGAGRG